MKKPHATQNFSTEYTTILIFSHVTPEGLQPRRPDLL